LEEYLSENLEEVEDDARQFRTATAIQDWSTSKMRSREAEV
jgi:hypothetical protein